MMNRIKKMCYTLANPNPLKYRLFLILHIFYIFDLNYIICFLIEHLNLISKHMNIYIYRNIKIDLKILSNPKLTQVLYYMI